MSEGPNLDTFRRKLEERRAREAAEKAATTPAFDADLIPDTPEPKRTDPDLDRLIEGIDITEAYRRWINKSEIKKTIRRKEGLKISCPLPDHPDRDPSAWVNTDKNVWYCGGCQEGGDVYDLAAIHFGFDRRTYKDGEQFHKLREKIAESMGYKTFKPPGAERPIYYKDEDPVTSETKETPEEAEEERRIAPVIDIHLDDDDEPIYVDKLNWEAAIPDQTFLSVWMRQCTVDDAPEEYHFWNGMMALALAVGRDVQLWDSNPVLANFFMVLMGPTGDGKSRSFGHLKRLLWAALPYEYDDPFTNGAMFVSSPASAEVLVHTFSSPIPDPAGSGKILGYAPVKGIIEFNELSALIGRAARRGNTLKPALMEFYDGADKISTTSMTSGRKYAENAFGCAHTTSQPLALKELLRESDIHSGFLNRWFFVSGTPKPRIAIGGVQVDVGPAVMPLRDIRSWGVTKRTVQWDDGAVFKFNTFFHETLHPLQRKDRSGLLARLDLLMKKIILLLAINEKTELITADLVDRAIGMFGYITSSYGVPARHVGSTQIGEIQDELLRLITRDTPRKGGMTMRDIQRALARKKWATELVIKALDQMVKLEIIMLDKTSGPGRPTIKYRLVG